MPIEVSGPEFSECVKFARLFSRTTSGDPVLKITLGVGVLTVAGTDGEVWTSRTIPAKSDEYKEILVNSEAVAVLSSIAAETFTLDPREKFLHLRWKGGQLKAAYGDDGIYITPMSIDTGSHARLPIESLKGLINRCTPARESRQAGTRWSNIFLQGDGDELACFASNGRVLHSAKVNCECDGFKLALSPKSTRAIAALADNQGGRDIEVGNGVSFMKIVCPSGHEVLAQVWPCDPWPSTALTLLDHEGGNSATIASGSFQDRLGRLCATNDVAVKTQFSMSGDAFNELCMASHSSDPVRYLEESVHVDGTIADGALIEARCLLGAVKCADGPLITLETGTNKKFIFIKGSDDVFKFRAAISPFAN